MDAEQEMVSPNNDPEQQQQPQQQQPQQAHEHKDDETEQFKQRKELKNKVQHHSNDNNEEDEDDEEDGGVNKKKEDYSFLIFASIIQGIVLILYAISVDYNDGTKKVDGEYDVGFYPIYQDVHGMMFVGFGFLMTFLRRYGFGSISYNFLLCAIGLQWGLYMVYMIPWWFKDNETNDKLMLTSEMLVDGDIAVAAVLISFGAVLGRTNPSQLIVMCFFELIFYALNFHIVVKYIKAIDVGGSIVVHTFGAYFGLAVSYWIGPPKDDSENKSQYHSDLFSMIGTLFLWLYWPSFNGYFAQKDYHFMDRAFMNTVLSLCGSVMSTFVVSRIFRKGKFDMVHIQNATLAGGVAIGAAADLYVHPSGAIGIGLVAGALSTFGYVKISDLLTKWKICDTCGVNNLHGMPGILGGIISAIVIGASKDKDRYVGCGEEGYPFPKCDLAKQAGLQLAAIGVTLGIAIVSGSMIGFLIRQRMIFRYPPNEFKDGDNFMVPLVSKDPFRGTIRKPHFGARDIENDDDFE